MARYQHLPIWRDAKQLLLVVEQAVRMFSRYHKYTVGSDLRSQAMKVCRLVILANSAWDERRHHVGQLVLAAEELKILIQLAKEVKAFASFKQFQEAAELAVAIGKQSGGWLRRVQSEVRTG